MGFTSRRLSWAGGIYQKLEDICTNSNMVQISCKYVEAVNEHVMKILDKDASQRPNPSDGCVDGPLSTSSLELTVEDSNDSGLGFDFDKKLSGCVKIQSVVSSEEYPSMTSLDANQDLSQHNKCDEHNKTSISIEAAGYDGCVDGPFSNLSSENIVEDCRELRAGLEENALDEKLSACVTVESIVSSEEDPSMTTLDADQGFSQRNTCDDHNKKSISIEATGSDGCVDGPISENIVGDCKESRVGLDKNDALDEKLLACVNVASIVSSKTDPSMASPDADQDSSQQNKCDEHGKKSISTEATASDGCFDEPVSNLPSENIVEDCKELIGSSDEDLNAVLLDADQDLSQQNACGENEKKSISIEATGSDFSADEFRPFESHQHESMEVGSMLSGFTSSIDIDDTSTSEETFLPQDSIQKPKIEISDDCDMEGVLDCLDVINLSTEQMEIFEDVNLGEYWDDIDYYELALISRYARKNMSYKKKLMRAVISKLRSSMGNKRVGNFYHDIVSGIDASSVSSADLYVKKSSTHIFCEGDWELL